MPGAFLLPKKGPLCSVRVALTLRVEYGAFLRVGYGIRNAMVRPGRSLGVAGSMEKPRHRDQGVRTRSQARERQRLGAVPACDSSVFPPLSEQTRERGPQDEVWQPVAACLLACG